MDALATQLAADGVQAQGFAADERKPAELARTMEAVTQALGPIEVSSPGSQKDFTRPVMETTLADLIGPIEFSIYGPVAAVHQVVPGMRFLGENRGTILFVNGGTALVPRAHLTGTSIAFAGETAYVQLLHEVLGQEGIQVSQLIIGGAIVAGDKEKDPEALAQILWDLHDKRDCFRVEVATG